VKEHGMTARRAYEVRRELARGLAQLLEGEARNEDVLADRLAEAAGDLEQEGSLTGAKRMRQASRRHRVKGIRMRAIAVGHEAAVWHHAVPPQDR
jgi:hypothetical protein